MLRGLYATQALKGLGFLLQCFQKSGRFSHYKKDLYHHLSCKNINKFFVQFELVQINTNCLFLGAGLKWQECKEIYDIKTTHYIWFRYTIAS